MKNLIVLLSIGLFIISCGQQIENGKKEVFKEKISDQEERVMELSKNIEKAKETDSAKVELVKVLLDYYHEFPKDKYSVNCLSKVHMVYTGMGNTEMAVAYADTIISNYPKFVDRPQMIESQIFAYEVSIAPRKVEMIKKYLNLWLKENKNASKEKISEMKYHLENVETPLLDRLGMNMNNYK